MQVELKSIQREVGITFLYVTHDQEEALTMSDRIAVFNHGRIEQIGTPTDVYERPRTEFVAGFVGISNVLTGSAAAAITGSEETVSIRPEKIRILPAGTSADDGHLTATGRVHSVVYLGTSTRYIVSLDAGAELTVVEQNTEPDSGPDTVAPDERVTLAWPSAALRPLAADEPHSYGGIPA